MPTFGNQVGDGQQVAARSTSNVQDARARELAAGAAQDGHASGEFGRPGRGRPMFDIPGLRKGIEIHPHPGKLCR